jgi:hypothetical protein
MSAEVIAALRTEDAQTAAHDAPRQGEQPVDSQAEGEADGYAPPKPARK